MQRDHVGNVVVDRSQLRLGGKERQDPEREQKESCVKAGDRSPCPTIAGGAGNALQHDAHTNAHGSIKNGAMREHAVGGGELEHHVLDDDESTSTEQQPLQAPAKSALSAVHLSQK